MAETVRKKSSLAKSVFSGSLGNILEWFDYGLYGYFATVISKNFFAAEDPMVGLIMSFMVFGISFLVRPIGGLLMGLYADKHGRVKSLMVTILAMGICTFLMGCLPTYAQIGIAAPILLTILRLCQGLATGGEFGSSLTFISEHQTGNNKAFLVSWQPFGVGAGLLLGSATGLIASSCLSEADLYSWGWRIPFLLGILISVYAFYMVKNVPESPEFLKMQEERAKGQAKEAAQPKMPLKKVFVQHWKSIVAVVGLLAGSSCTYYLLVTYMPTYLSQFAQTTMSASFLINTCAVLFYVVLCPFAGKLIDKIGIRTSLVIGSIGFLVLSYPIFNLLIHQTEVLPMIGLLMILMVFQTILAIAIATASTDVFPAEVRNSGVGFAYNLAAAIFGGMAPAAATMLIAGTGNVLSLVFLILGAIAITLLTSLTLLRGFYPKKK